MLSFLPISIVSVFYFVFLAVGLLAYYLIPKKGQWIVLLVTSGIFYFLIADTIWTICYLIISILITWGAGLVIAKKRGTNISKAVFIIALILNFGMLFALKYTNFVLSNASYFHNLFHHTNVAWSVNWPAALGISYYTLQITGYLIDCQWGVNEPEKNIAKLALFTSFFPQMVSGPISRHSQLAEELFSTHRFDKANLREGITRIVIGLAKKVLIAGQLGIFTNTIFNSNDFKGIILILGFACFIIQLYMDFSGCMDIVIGSAKCFGITMVENFDKPFSSRTIQEFWRRWHITLGQWLRDYIMYPILRTKLFNKWAKSLKKHNKTLSKKLPLYVAMLILWLCFGLWHGGEWHYVIEGLWFWLIIVISDLLQPVFKKAIAVLKINTENRFWILFQCVRTTLIFAIGNIFFFFTIKDGAMFIYNSFEPISFFHSFTTVANDIKLSLTSSFETIAICVALIMFLVLVIFEHFLGSCYLFLQKRMLIMNITA